MALGRKTGGRKKGTPNKATAEVRELAREYTPAVVKALFSIVEDTKAPSAARVSAGAVLLDRGHGKPTTSVDMRMDGQVSLVDLLTSLAVVTVNEPAADDDAVEPDDTETRH